LRLFQHHTAPCATHSRKTPAATSAGEPACRSRAALNANSTAIGSLAGEVYSRVTSRIASAEAAGSSRGASTEPLVLVCK
jgi:hypothetical protein